MPNAVLSVLEKAFFKRGRKIFIPAGVEISSMHPKQPGKSVNKRGRWVTLHSICDGISFSVDFWLRTDSCRDKFRLDHPNADCDAAFAAYDALRGRRDASTDKDEIRSLWEQMQGIRVWTRKPSVSWAGSGGYWCDCPLEDVRNQPQRATNV